MSIEKNRDELNEKLDENTVDAISEDVITEDAEIKKMFEEEFDMADLTVSEDLIARTMTAIHGLSGDEAGTKPGFVSESTNQKSENIPTKVTSITDRTEASKTTEASGVRKSSVIKWISGIAAALFIGVVGFTFIKLGLNGSVKNDSENAVNTSANSESYEGIKADGPRKYSEKDYSINQPKTETSASVPMSNEAYSYEGDVCCEPTLSISDSEYKLGSDEMKYKPESEDMGTINQGKQAFTSPTDIIPDDLIPGTTDNAGGSAEVDNSDDKEAAEARFEEFVALKSELILQSTANYRNAGKADKDAVIRETPEYKTILGVDGDTSVVLYNLLSKSEGDAELEYIYAILLEDVSGKTFTDEDDADTWSTGKEYLELYEACMKITD